MIIALCYRLIALFSVLWAVSVSFVRLCKASGSYNLEHS